MTRPIRDGCHNDGLPDPAWSTPLILDGFGHSDGEHTFEYLLVYIPTCYDQQASNLEYLKDTGDFCLSTFALQCSNVVSTSFYKVK